MTLNRDNIMSKYQVIVGNVGIVYDGDDGAEAQENYNEYAKQSQEGYGRASNEQVTLFVDGEVALEIDFIGEDDSMIICTGCEKTVKEHGYCDKDGNGYGECCWSEHVDKCESCKEDVNNA